MMHKAKKQFGQNFLQDAHIIGQIIKAIRPSRGETIIEIGPGLGALTTELLPHVETLNVIELDYDVIPLLKNRCEKKGHLIVHQGDALRVDFNQFYANTPLRIVGNLPYNISTPLLFHFLNYRHLIRDMHFMLQKEVVDRITAKPGSKAYGRLSVMIQYYCDTQALFDVPPHAFIPAPKVDSAVVRLTPYQESPYEVVDPVYFSALVQQAFSQRRKTLRNTLKTLVTESDWVTANIDPQARAETLSVQDFVRLSLLTGSNTER